MTREAPWRRQHARALPPEAVPVIGVQVPGAARRRVAVHEHVVLATEHAVVSRLRDEYPAGLHALQVGSRRFTERLETVRPEPVTLHDGAALLQAFGEVTHGAHEQRDARLVGKPHNGAETWLYLLKG